VFTSWVLGYIPLRPFFAAARQALRPGGYLAFIVHRENSPREPSEIFAELVAADPAVLEKRVAFDFPRHARHVEAELATAGFTVKELLEDQIAFQYQNAAVVLDHLLKSGAGTAFYEAITPARRADLTAQFLQRLEARHPAKSPFHVVHEYVLCLAQKPFA